MRAASARSSIALSRALSETPWAAFDVVDACVAGVAGLLLVAPSDWRHASTTHAVRKTGRAFIAQKYGRNAGMRYTPAPHRAQLDFGHDASSPHRRGVARSAAG